MENHDLCTSMPVGDLLPNSEFPTNTIVARDTTMSNSMNTTIILLDSGTLTYNVVTENTELCPLVPTTADFLMSVAANPQKVLIPAFCLVLRLCSVKIYKLYNKILLY
jgi:hypothetical protein